MDQTEALYWSAIDDATARRNLPLTKHLVDELSTHTEQKPPDQMIEY